jgi:hypothetical protein
MTPAFLPASALCVLRSFQVFQVFCVLFPGSAFCSHRRSSWSHVPRGYFVILDPPGRTHRGAAEVL